MKTCSQNGPQMRKEQGMRCECMRLNEPFAVLFLLLYS
nr:MAG TPA: hypothetical protein [Caudoviricetes sp.]